MFRLIKQVFIALLSFNGSLINRVDVSDHARCLSLNDLL